MIEASLGGGAWHPKILSPEESLDSLIEKPRSFCRFGDGEIQIMKGISIPFQQYDPMLADKMLAILRSNRNECLVGINYSYYVWPKEGTDYGRDWTLKNRMYFLSFLEENLNRGRQYIAAEFNQGYMSTKDVNTESFINHYAKITRLFEGKKLVIFAGNNILAGLEHNVFARAKEVELVHCPKENAFAAHGQILEKAHSYSKDEVVLGFILGPTATVAAWDLSLEGYLAWDLGHIAKDYDAYCRQVERNDEEVMKFYAPD